MKTFIITIMLLLQFAGFTGCSKDDAMTGGLTNYSDGPLDLNTPPNDTLYNSLLGPTEIIFYNLHWTSPWYNTIEIPDMLRRGLNLNPFTVYVQRHGKSDWIEVPRLNASGSNYPYEYFISTNQGGFYLYGSLCIFYYGNDVSDTPNVKVVF